MINVEFVPPKPNELLKKVSKCLVMVLLGMSKRAEFSSGFSKLMFPAIKSFFIINIEYITSLAPAIHIS